MKAGKLKEIIDKIIDSEGLTISEIASRSDVDRSYLSKVINGNGEKKITAGLAGRLNKTFPDYFNPATQNNTFSREKTTDNTQYHEIAENTSDDNLTKKMLADLVHSNKNLSESNKSLSRSHEELVGMVKKDASPDDDHITLQETVATVIALKESLIEISAELKKVSKVDATKDFRNKVRAAMNMIGNKGSRAEVSR